MIRGASYGTIVNAAMILETVESVFRQFVSSGQLSYCTTMPDRQQLLHRNN